MTAPDETTPRGARSVGNLIRYGGAQIGSAALALVVVGILSRALDRAGFGEYSFAFVLASFAGLIADYGMGPWLTRAVAQRPHDARVLLAETLRRRRWTLAIAWVLLLAGGAVYLQDAGRWTSLALLLGYVTALGYVGLHESALMGAGRAGLVSVSVLGGKLLELTAVCAWLFFGGAPEVAGFAAALAAAAVLRWAAVHVLTSRLFAGATATGGEPRAAGSDGAFDPTPAGLGPEFWRRVTPFALGSITWAVYFRVDMILLERWSAPAALGLYAAAYRVLDALLLIPRTMMGVIYPVFSAAAARRAVYGELLERPSRALAAIALAVAAGLWGNAGDVLAFLFGERFRDAAPILRVLAVVLPAVFANQFLGMLLSALDRQNAWVRVLLLATAVNVAANVVLIPRLGPLGAALATAISETGSLVALGVLTARAVRWPWSLAWTVRAAVAAGVAGAATAYLPLPLLARAAAGVLVYLPLARLLDVFAPADWALAGRFLRRAAGRAATTP
jgi:O-antigen/teichoic acid export membrane protein